MDPFCFACILDLLPCLLPLHKAKWVQLNGKIFSAVVNPYPAVFCMARAREETKWSRLKSIRSTYPLNNFYVNTKCEIVPQTLVYFTRKQRRKQISIVVQLRLKKEILLNTCCLHTTMIWNTWQWDQNHPLSWNLTVNSVGRNFNSLK